VTAPTRDVDRVADAQARFDAAISGISDVEILRPSLLEGWTVGHVLAHVARNADSHRRRTEAAAEGRIVEQYVGGYTGRSAEIDGGSQWPAAVLVEDVRSSGAAVVVCWRSLPGSTWSNKIRDVAGREHELSWLPGRRWQELEIHLVDLGIGITADDWPDEFVADRLPALRDTVVHRLHARDSAPAPGSLSERDELAWLFGRPRVPGLPRLGSWE
jgi:maleylpyruvate isomerase